MPIIYSKNGQLKVVEISCFYCFFNFIKRNEIFFARQARKKIPSLQPGSSNVDIKQWCKNVEFVSF